mgnify:CR=1 FL=1
MTNARFARLSSRLFNVPLAIRQDKAEMLVAALAQRLGIVSLHFDADDRVLDAAALQSMSIEGMDGERGGGRCYDTFHGVAMMPIEGTLVHKLGGVDPWCGMTGYDQIAYKMREAMDDPDVKAIWLDIDSPGGEVSGCFDLCDEIAACSAANGGKPIWGFVNEMACSAAYAIASQCDQIIMPRTGVVGSIGVLTMHVDFSKALAMDGIKPTLIHAGSHKVDGNAYEPLPDSVRADIQASLEKVRLLFADTVARGRKTTRAKMLATEARCYDAQEALGVGLIDAVASEMEAFAAMLTTLGSIEPHQGD